MHNIIIVQFAVITLFRPVIDSRSYAMHEYIIK